MNLFVYAIIFVNSILVHFILGSPNSSPDPRSLNNVNANGKSSEEIEALIATSKAEFLQEMWLMKELGKFKHILSLVGVCTIDKRELLVVLEYATQGDLRNWLMDRRAKDGRPEAVGQAKMPDLAWYTEFLY